MESKVLIVEDSRSCQIIAKESALHLGVISIAENCLQARTFVNENIFDIILMDMILPDGDGIELFSEFKSHKNCINTHFVFVTSDDNVMKKVAVFAVGADDYVVKPYSRLELRARLDRIMRHDLIGTIYCNTETGIKLDSYTLKAYLNVQEKSVPIDLTPHEFKILNLLIRHEERIYSRNQIIDLVWGENVNISDRTVDVHVSSLRKKLSDKHNHIVCVRGEGYKWKCNFK